jgi:hypothetical protein
VNLEMAEKPFEKPSLPPLSEFVLARPSTSVSAPLTSFRVYEQACWHSGCHSHRRRGPTVGTGVRCLIGGRHQYRGGEWLVNIGRTIIANHFPLAVASCPEPATCKQQVAASSMGRRQLDVAFFRISVA